MGSQKNKVERVYQFQQEGFKALAGLLGPGLRGRNDENLETAFDWANRMERRMEAFEAFYVLQAVPAVQPQPKGRPVSTQTAKSRCLRLDLSSKDEGEELVSKTGSRRAVLDSGMDRNADGWSFTWRYDQVKEVRALAESRTAAKIARRASRSGKGLLQEGSLMGPKWAMIASGVYFDD